MQTEVLDVFKSVQNTNDEMSTMTFDDLMAFVGADDYAYAA